MVNLPTSSIRTLSIPALSTLTKWELTKWELTKWEVDEMGIDEVGIDKVGITPHTILWIKDAPKLGVDSDEDVCKFVDQYISCSNPADADLAHFVTKLPKHRHSATCRRNGHCRFHYPHPPSPQTIIAEEFLLGMCSSNQADKAITALVAVKKALDDKHTREDISLDELLDKAGVSYMHHILSTRKDVLQRQQYCYAKKAIRMLD